MAKIFNVTADCKPDKHYMVKLDTRLAAIKKMVDAGDYFTINRARQYGKTTILRALNKYLQDDYYVILMDFQTFGAEEFVDENTFALSFFRSFLRIFRKNAQLEMSEWDISRFEKVLITENSNFRLQMLFEYLYDICAMVDKPLVLMIDEVDSASNNQVFWIFWHSCVQVISIGMNSLHSSR